MKSEWCLPLALFSLIIDKENLTDQQMKKKAETEKESKEVKDKLLWISIDWCRILSTDVEIWSTPSPEVSQRKISKEEVDEYLCNVCSDLKRE